METEYRGKRVLVVGMARSGLAAAKLLLHLGAVPVLSDTRADVEGVDALVAAGCEARLGEPSEALLEGVAEVVVSPAVPVEAPVIRGAQRLGIPVLAELELAARHVQGTQLAITGTNGKTSTCTLLGEMLKNAGRHVYVAGNIGYPLSSVALEATQEDDVVIEVSSFQLEHMPLFHPRGAALLNLTPDHLNRHGTMEAYGALKEGMLRNQNEADFFVYNADDAFCRQAAQRAAAQTIPFSRLMVLSQGSWVEDGQLVLAGRALCPVEDVSLPGPHNLENALAAAAMAGALNVPPAVIRHTIRTFAGVEHRMETVRTLHGVRWINDSKGTNPDSSIRAVQGMTVPTILIAGGDEKSTDFLPLAEAVAENAHIRHVVLIGKTAGRLSDALAQAGYTAVMQAGYDLEKAVTLASGLSEEGGAVLLSPACASFDMFSDYEARGRAFKALVQALP